MTKLRPSPTISATKNNIGTIKRGNDGHRYIVKKSVVGIKRWVRYNKVSKKKSKKGSKKVSKKKSKKGSKKVSKKKSKKGSKKGSKRKSKKGSKKGSKRKSKKGSKKGSKRKSKKGSKRKSKKGSKRKSKKGSKKGSKKKSKRVLTGRQQEELREENFKESLKKKGPKESSKKYSYGTIKTGQDGKKYQVVGHLNNYGNLMNKHWSKISNKKGHREQ
jgi:hypothetical protein